MEHTKGFALALCAIGLCMLVEVLAQPVQSAVPVKGMIWTEDDQAEPVAMTGSCGFLIASNTLTFTDYNIEQGYFEVGEFQGQLRPESPWIQRIHENRGKGVDVLLRVHTAKRLEKVVR